MGCQRQSEGDPPPYVLRQAAVFRGAATRGRRAMAGNPRSPLGGNRRRAECVYKNVMRKCSHGPSPFSPGNEPAENREYIIPTQTVKGPFGSGRGGA